MPVKKKQPKKEKLEPITLTIRANTDPDIKILHELKKETGCYAYSQALMKAARDYPVQIRIVESLRKQIRDLEKIKTDQEHIIHFVHSSQKMVEQYGKTFLKNKGKFPEPEIEFDEHEM